MTTLNSLGVEKGKVILSNFQESWNRLFEEEQKYLSKILSISNNCIFHIGSTSVLNCVAKPIVDIAIPYNRLSGSYFHQQVLSKTNYALNNIYYLSDRICYAKGNPQTYHLYLIDKESATFQNWIIFKEILSTNNELLTAYCNLKKELAAKYPDDRVKYTDEKSNFIYSALNKNKLWHKKILSMKI